MYSGGASSGRVLLFFLLTRKIDTQPTLTSADGSSGQPGIVHPSIARTRRAFNSVPLMPYIHLPFDELWAAP